MRSGSEPGGGAIDHGPAADREPAAVLETLPAKFRQLHDETRKVGVGQSGAIEAAVDVLLSRRHCLLEGVRELAKTLIVRAPAGESELNFARIQFTPDLTPSDIAGKKKGSGCLRNGS